MADRNKIIKFCEDYLKADAFNDFCHNGLQVEGAEKITKIITGVSLSQRLIKIAIDKKAEMILVHHGIFKSQIEELPQFKGVLRNRLKLILENNLNLAGFHLPLDAHREIGNNISLCRLFGLTKIKPFDVGFVGELKAPIDFDKFVSQVNSKLKTNAYALNSGRKKVKNIGIISGGASSDYEHAAYLGADVLLCGDLGEWVVRGAEELHINIINAGHYNTEKLGIQNLGNLVAKKFKVKVEFVDIPCDI